MMDISMPVPGGALMQSSGEEDITVLLRNAADQIEKEREMVSRLRKAALNHLLFGGEIYAKELSEALAAFN